jgi:WD40 repeat protein
LAEEFRFIVSPLFNTETLLTISLKISTIGKNNGHRSKALFRMQGEMEDNRKPVKWEKVHIFVSSTFNDMHAERDYLVKQVFPKLAEWCEKRKLRMVDIDLRWGVTEADATQNRNVVNVCLKRIDECRPFFLCLLGQRYGWVPGRRDVSRETFDRFPGLEEAVNKGASVTEIEVLHALVSPFHAQATTAEKDYHPSKYAFFYIRDDAYLDDMPSEPAYRKRIYTDLEETDEKKRTILVGARLELLKKIEDTGRPAYTYTGRWSKALFTPEIALPLQCPATIEENQALWRKEWLEQAGVRVSGLNVGEAEVEEAKAREFNKTLSEGRLTDFTCRESGLGDVILEELKGAIEERFPDHREVVEEDDLQKEIDQQEHFVFVNSEGFIRRSGDFDELDAYVQGDSNKLFVLTAEAGMGKSMLLSNWIDRIRAKIAERQGESAHFRFIGTSDSSTTVHSLLRLLLREIKDVGGKLDTAIPESPQEIRNALPELLTEIGRKGKTVIVLDALNQLESGLSDLSWLPKPLPPNIKLVVSFKRGEEAAEELYGQMARDERVQLSTVKPFAELQDRRKLVEAYLSQYLKELDERHIQALIESEAAQNPLYLKVVLSELRVFGAFASLQEKLQSDFGSTPLSAFTGVLERLENDPAYTPIPPDEADPLLFGLMSYARHGLSADELTGLLMLATGNWDTEESRKRASDTVYFFLRQVRPFLAKREGRYDFFYESFKNAALLKYTSEENRHPGRSSLVWHTILATYFLILPKKSRRRISELPYHLTKANTWDELENILCDLDFIGTKCAAGMVYDLVDDYALALDSLPESREDNQSGVERSERIKKYTADLIAYAKGDIDRLDIMPSTKPWGEKEILENSERVLQSPSRLDRIKAFSHFVRSDVHALVKYSSTPGFVLQHAYNASKTGPIAKAAEEEVDGFTKSPLLLKLPQRRPDYTPHPAQLAVLEGHTGWVGGVCVTPDGRRALSGSYDKTIRVWDVETGKCLKILEGAACEIHSLSITPDGRFAVSGEGNYEFSVRLWDIETGECLKTFKGGRDKNEPRLSYSLISGISVAGAHPYDMYGRSRQKKESQAAPAPDGHKDEVLCVSITPDGRLAASGSRDRTVRVWDLERGRCLHTFEGHKREVKGVGITADGRRVVSAGWDGTIRVWDVTSGRCQMIIDVENVDQFTKYKSKSSINGLTISPDGKKALTGDVFSNLMLWDLETGENLKSLKGHRFECVVAVHDFRIAVSGSNEQTIQVWDLETGECLRTLSGHTQDIWGVSISADGSRAVSGGQDNTVRVWDIERGVRAGAGEIHLDSVEDIAVTPDGKMAASRSRSLSGQHTPWKYALRTWDFKTGEPLHSLKGHKQEVKSVALSPDNRSAVSVSSDQMVYVWDLETGKNVKSGREHRDWIYDVKVTPDGRRAVTSDSKGNIFIWDMARLEFLKKVEAHDKGIENLILTHDGRCVISSSWDKSLGLTDLDTGRFLGKVEGADFKDPWCDDRTPDGKAALVRVSGWIWRWNLGEGESSFSEKNTEPFPERLYSTPQGRLAAAKTKHACGVVNIASGEYVVMFEGHEDKISDVKISLDGKRVLTSDEDKTVRIWDIRTGECLAVHQAGEAVPSLSRIRPDGTFAYGTRSGDIVLVAPRNFLLDAPVTTAMRLWIFGESGAPGKRQDETTAVCLWCGKRFTVDAGILDVIAGIVNNAGLTPKSIPCLELPEEAWEEPKLASECPHCRKPLRFNPFIAT